ncbi:hypothetical protein JNN96_30560 [Mycobacterium sp. DSM 3803]|nr:hypothetical protein [Mycobacterium sp. DSM 3803]
MFEHWAPELCGYRTLHVVDRWVRVDIAKAFPALMSGGTRRDEIPMWVKSGGVFIAAPYMRAHQIAWVKRANDNVWLAVVLMPVASGNGQSHVTMQLWLEPGMIIPLKGEDDAAT